MARKPERHIQERVTLVMLERKLVKEQNRGKAMNNKLNALLKHLLKKKMNPNPPKVKVYRSERPWREEPLTKK